MVSFPHIFEIYIAKAENCKDILTKFPVIVKGLNIPLSKCTVETDKNAIDTVNDFEIYFTFELILVDLNIGQSVSKKITSTSERLDSFISEAQRSE